MFSGRYQIEKLMGHESLTLTVQSLRVHRAHRVQVLFQICWLKRSTKLLSTISFRQNLLGTTSLAAHLQCSIPNVAQTSWKQFNRSWLKTTTTRVLRLSRITEATISSRWVENDVLSFKINDQRLRRRLSSCLTTVLLSSLVIRKLLSRSVSAGICVFYFIYYES